MSRLVRDAQGRNHSKHSLLIHRGQTWFLACRCGCGARSNTKSITTAWYIIPLGWIYKCDIPTVTNLNSDLITYCFK